LNFKNSENKKIKSGIRTHNPWCLRLRNTCAIGCAKKTAENIFKNTNIYAVFKDDTANIEEEKRC